MPTKTRTAKTPSRGRQCYLAVNIGVEAHFNSAHVKFQFSVLYRFICLKFEAVETRTAVEQSAQLDYQVIIKEMMVLG